MIMLQALKARDRLISACLYWNLVFHFLTDYSSTMFQMQLWVPAFISSDVPTCQNFWQNSRPHFSSKTNWYITTDTIFNLDHILSSSHWPFDPLMLQHWAIVWWYELKMNILKTKMHWVLFMHFLTENADCSFEINHSEMFVKKAVHWKFPWHVLSNQAFHGSRYYQSKFRYISFLIFGKYD